MTKKKNLPAKPEPQNEKNNTGLIPTREYIELVRDKITNDEERIIFEDAYNSLELINRNNLQVIPHLLAYAKAFALHIKILEEAGDDYQIDGQINPLFLLADKQLSRAQTLSKMLGIDNWSRDRVMQGEKPNKPEVAKTDQEQKKEDFLNNTK